MQGLDPGPDLKIPMDRGNFEKAITETPLKIWVVQKTNTFYCID
jgi:hypothetical protein